MTSWEREIYEDQAMEHNEAAATAAVAYVYIQIARDKPFSTVQASLQNTGGANGADYIVYGSNYDLPGDPGTGKWFEIKAAAVVAHTASGHGTVATCARNVALGYKSADGTTVAASLTGV